VTRAIQVIPNFLDCDIYKRGEADAIRRRLTGGDPATRLVTHISNFRPVKRIDAVIDVFDRIRRRVPAHLLLVGDGPELPTAYRMAKQRNISGIVHAVGAQEEVIPLLSASDLFLLPSAQESFGLAALEAMACEVPVVASDVGGLPEVIENGVSGVLHPPDAHEAMAESASVLLTDVEQHRTMAQAARHRVLTQFCTQYVVPMYEACYEAVLAHS
jgi:N-acetyl-alpha-D-glucosaminyl L-malate synthase BshA